MRRIFSVSMPRAGHHVAEMVLGRCLRSNFHYCEYYTPINCCKRIPCTRMDVAEASGAVVFMQKSHDHDLSDPETGEYDGCMIQVREPIARVLSNYELELESSGIEHSQSYQQFWLGLEAFYTVGFIEKWCRPRVTRSLVLRYEDLIRDPVEYFRRIFVAFDIPLEFFSPETVRQAQGVSSASKGVFTPRAVGSSMFYDDANLAAFGRLVAPAASALGYSLPVSMERDGDAKQVELVFRAKTQLGFGDFQGALELINECLQEPLAHPFLLRIRGSIYATLGLAREAEADYLTAIHRAASHPDAYLQYATLLKSRNASAATIDAVLRECLDKVGNKGACAEAIQAHFPNSEAAVLAKSYVRPPVSRDQVITAFKVLLGREPEDERVIVAHQNVDSLDSLRKVLLGSEEFAQKFREMALPLDGLERTGTGTTG